MKTPTTEIVLSECHQRTVDVDFTDLARMYNHACKLEEALRKIMAIENQSEGGTWDEIEEARAIAEDSLIR